MKLTRTIIIYDYNYIMPLHRGPSTKNTKSTKDTNSAVQTFLSNLLTVPFKQSDKLSDTSRTTTQHRYSRRSIIEFLLGSALAAECITSCKNPALDKEMSTGSTSHFSTSPTAHPPMTLAQQIGQHIIYSYPGITPPQALLERIHDGLVGGVIFFGDNITTRAQLQQVTAHLNDVAVNGKLGKKLLLATDQEGGLVSRVPQETLSEKAIGSSEHPLRLVHATAKDHAMLLASCGINLNLSPVVDVYRTTGNFIDRYGRSYNSDPQKVAALARGYITTLQAHNVQATAKHFPGLGSAPTDADTDLKPVTLPISAQQLDTIDLIPFRAAIAAKVACIMMSWAVYPALDSAHPAGLSRKIVTSLLRQQLGYSGVIITDALEAGAVRSLGTGNSAIAALAAGNDMVCCSLRSVDQGDQAAAGILAGITDGRITRSEFDASTARINAVTR